MVYNPILKILSGQQDFHIVRYPLDKFRPWLEIGLVTSILFIIELVLRIATFGFSSKEIMGSDTRLGHF